MSDDAHEFLDKLKESLVVEVNDNVDYLTNSITTYLDMFDSGVIEKSRQCSVCNSITKEDTGVTPRFRNQEWSI